MWRPAGVVLLLFLTGCGSAVEQPIADVRPLSEVRVTTTTTTATSVPSPSTSTSTSTSTSLQPRTTTTVARPPATVAPARAPATAAAPRVTTVPSTARGCDPNYAGACVPSGPDVDCADLNARRFRVIGEDIFRLDGDGDGIACEGPP